MSSIGRMLHLQGLTIAIFISLEISGYFFYLYFKKKKENIFLNKILLAFGLLFGIGLTSITLQIMNNYYNKDPISHSIISNWIHMSIAGAILIFQLIISTKDFNDLIKNKVTWSIILINVILSTFIMISRLKEGLDLLILIIILLGIIFLFIFQINLIRYTNGKIKRRFKIITLGTLMITGAALISSNEFINNFLQISEMILLIASLIMIGGMLIILFSIYHFPVFLEFNWRSELVSLFIIEKRHHNKLFSYSFLKTEQKYNFNPDLISEGIFGIQTIISAITATPNKIIHRIEQKGFIILIDSSDSVIYAMVVNKELKSLYYFLNTIRNNFESIYKSLIKDLHLIRGREEIYFLGFDEILNEILEN